MKALAVYIMRGKSQATLVTTTLGLLALLLPFLGLLSSAAVGLVTLRNGIRSGFIIISFATVAAGIFTTLVLNAPILTIGLLLIFWLPLWGLALVLRFSRSLDLTVQVAGVLGLIIILLTYAILGNPAEFWINFLEPLRHLLITSEEFTVENSRSIIQILAQWMTGACIATLLTQVLTSLLLARSWQAALYNPGKFNEEFCNLRLGRLFGGITLILLVFWVSLIRGSGLIFDLLLTLGFLWCLQGLAVAHEVRRRLNASFNWLVILYVLLTIFLPQMGLIVAGVGLLDIWINIRNRISPRSKNLLNH